MALITSAASGNFSAGATWTGGVVPGVGDEARAATGHTVTIDVNTTCDTVSHAGTGTFILSSGVTLTANLVSAGSGATTVMVQLTSTNSASVVGTVNGSTGSNSGITTLANIGSGTLTITGNAIGSASASTFRNCIQNRSTGKIIMTGNLTGGSGASTNSVLENTGTGEIDLTGNTTSNTATFAPCRNTSTGTFQVLGNLTASNSAPAFESEAIRARNVLRGNFQSSAQGVLPIYAQNVILGSAPSQNEFIFAVDGISTTATFYTADALLGVPSESDVRSGTIYGASNELTGTCAVPAAASVAFGVSVDATTGTAVLTPAAVWEYATREITNAPASVTPSDIWSHSSRTITGGTVDTLTNAPSVPTAAAIATAVRTELTEISNLDASVSSRLAAADYVAPANSDVAAVKAVTDALNTERLANVATTAIVGNLIAQANS